MQVGHQAFIDHALAQPSVAHRPGDFDAPQHVARHPVGARKVEPFVVFAGAEAKVQHARVLEKAPNHRAHADAFGVAGHTGGEHARAAHDEVDVDAGLRRGDQGLDERLVGQRVELEHDARGLPQARRRSAALDQGEHLALQAGGRQQQPLGRLAARQARKLLEHEVGVGRDVGVGGEAANVGVEAGCFWVVVAGREVGITAQATAFAARHEHQLCMRFQADDPVHHLCAHGLESLGPVDVGLFVEARLELHHGHHFLAAPRGLEQQFHQLAFAAGAVNGLLDGQHIGVGHCLAQEGDHRLEALEGVVQQHVALLEAVEQRTGRARRAQCLGPGGLERGEAQLIGLGLVDQLVKTHQVDRAVDEVERGVGQAELLQQKLAQLFRTRFHDLQADGLAKMAGRKRGAQGLSKVGHFLFVDIEVGVARDAELRERLHAAPGKQLRQVRTDHAREQHETLPRGRHLVGQPDDARQHARNLDDGNRVVAPEGVAPAELDDEVERLVGHLRERVRRVQPHRHEQRAHLLLKKGVDPAALRLVALGVAEHADAAGLQRGHHDVVEGGVLGVDQFVCGCGHLGHLAVGNARKRQARGLQVVGEAHLEKLVEVGRNDGDVAQPLEQRHVFAQRLRQHAAVELEDGLLAVEQDLPDRAQHGGKIGTKKGGHSRSLDKARGSLVTCDAGRCKKARDRRSGHGPLKTDGRAVAEAAAPNNQKLWLMPTVKIVVFSRATGERSIQWWLVKTDALSDGSTNAACA